MASNRKDKKDGKTTGKRSRARTLNFSRRNMEKYAKKTKSPPQEQSNAAPSAKDFEEERKQLEQERRRLENDKRHLKNAQNKLHNENTKLMQSTQKQSTKDLTKAQKLQQEVDDYKAEIEQLKKYKKQMTALKKQQSKTSHKKDGAGVRYVFAENIAEIRVARHGVYIRYHGDGDNDDDEGEQLHKDVRVVLPQHLVDNEQLVTYMMNELQERLDDVRHVQSLIGYRVSADIEQYVHDTVSKRHLSEHTNFNPFMVNNNKLWRYALLQKKEATDKLFSVWMQAQCQIQAGQQPQICVEHGVALQNMHRHHEAKLDMSVDLNRALTGRRFQREINLNTDAMDWIKDHHGAYEYDEDNDHLGGDVDDMKHPPLSLLYASSVSASCDTPVSPHSMSRSAEDPSLDALNGDPHRSLMRAIVVDEEQTAELTNLALFLDVIMAQVKTRTLADAGDSKRMVAALFDGVLFGQLLNLIQADCVDVSAMQQQRKQQSGAAENMTLVVNTMYALHLVSPWIDDSRSSSSNTSSRVLKVNPLRLKEHYLNAQNTVSVLLQVGACLIETWFTHTQLNVRRFPQLIRLCQNDDEIADCRRWPYQAWLQRWLLFLKNPKYKYQRNNSHSKNNRSLKHSIDLKNHLTNGDFSMLAVASRSRGGSTPATPNPNSRRLSDLAQISEVEQGKLGNTFALNAINVALSPSAASVSASAPSSAGVSPAVTPTFPSMAKTTSALDDEKYAQQYASVAATATDEVLKVHEILNLPMTDHELVDVYPRSLYVQHLLLVRAFERKNNIDVLSEKEKQTFNNVTRERDTDNDETTTTLLAWINWVNALHSYRWKMVRNLQKHLSDGLVILHLLDTCKNGVVDWTNNVKQSIRSSKDKSVNCKEIIAICERLPLKVVGMDESVLVAGNKKYIAALLKQIRSYYLAASILKCLNIPKTPSEVQCFDALVLKWSNAQFVQFLQNHSHDGGVILFGTENEAKSLNTLGDASLSDCIYCLNVLSSIDEKFVNYQFVQKNDEHSVQNARYLSAVIRRLGFNVFASPQSIVQCQCDAMLNIFCCIVNIAFLQQ